MFFILFILFLALVFSLILSLIKNGKQKNFSRIFRAVTVIFGISVFAYWFFERSFDRFVKDAVSVQVVNLLPQPLDFYLVKIDSADKKNLKITKNLGMIRPEHYRIEYLKMDKSDEFWIAGFLGKKNLVYFSQHAVPNKNVDQIIQAKNYIIQSGKLASEAKKEIDAYSFQNIKLGVWATLDLLLLFLNFVLLLRRK